MYLNEIYWSSDMHCYILKYNESWGILQHFKYKWTKYVKHYRCCAKENKRTTNMFEEQTGVRQGYCGMMEQCVNIKREKH